MSDTYRPQPWLSPYPSQAGSPSPMGLQVDTHVPSDASDVDKGVLMWAAHEIVQGNGTQLDRFVANQRQQIGTSEIGYYERRTDMQGMTARYTWNNGREKLKLDVYPTGGQNQPATTSDTNLDGYVLWIHGEPVYPVQSPVGIVPVGPYAVFMNGYLLEESVQPSNYFQGGNCSAYAMLFGRTALLCASYTGDVEKMNDLINTGNFKLPFKMTPDSPGQYDAGDEIDGTNQPKVAKKFNYGLFDWMNVFNNCSFINYVGTGGLRWNDHQLWKSAEDWGDNDQGQAHIGDPYVWGGIYFPDVRDGKSPLKANGQNTVGVLGFANTYAPCFDCFVAEFYDRGKYAIVRQSWNIPQRPIQTIAVNNTPLLFAEMDYQIGYGTGNGSSMPFDLTAANTKNKPDYAAAHTEYGGLIVLDENSPNPSLMGPHDCLIVGNSDNPGRGPGQAASQEASDALAEWHRANAAQNAQYNATIQRLTTQWQTDYSFSGQYAKEWIQTQNVQSFWDVNTDANGKILATSQKFFATDFVRTADVDPQGVHESAGFLQEYLFCWNSPSLTLPRAAARWLYTYNYGNKLLLDVNGNPDLNPVNYNGSFFGGTGQAWLTYQQCFDLATQYLQDHTQNMYLRQQDAYAQIFKDNPPPKPIPFTGAGGDLPFKYQRFTDWGYTQ